MKLTKFRTRLSSLSREIVQETSRVLEDKIRENITPPGGAPLDLLAARGHPLGRGSKFNPGAAGLSEPYQIIRQSGGLLSVLGRDSIKVSGDGASVFVGFEHTGSHTSETVSGTQRTVPMNDLLQWLILGTPVLVGRPVLNNSLADALPDMRSILRDKGLKRTRVVEQMRRLGVSR